jgi:hypothetical protein
MKSRIPLKTTMEAEIIRPKGVQSIIPIGAWWEFEHYRKGALIDKWAQKNVNTTEGLNHLLNVGFHGDTPITTWYMLLFDDNYTPLITDTYAVPGFTESADYDEATRPEFVEAEATARVITNVASKATFTINATTTIYGAALVGGGTDGNTKSDAAGGGVLFSASKFASHKECVDDDVLMVSCSITLADV